LLLNNINNDIDQNKHIYIVLTPNKFIPEKFGGKNYYGQIYF